METKNVLFSKSYLDIIFENRNQEYGAYQLRNEYERNIRFALFVMFSILVVLFTTNIVYEYFHHVKPLTLTAGKHVLVDVKPIDVPQIVEQQPMKKGSLPKTPNENLQMKVVQNTRQELKKDSVIEDQPLAYNNHGNTGQIGVPEGVEGAVNTIPNLVPVAPIPSMTPVPWAEVMPEFIGGESAMMSFIKNRLEFPTIERENGISGNVIVSFVVNEDGSVSDIKTLKATTKNFQRASEDVVAQFPKFKPGKQGDKFVKVRMTIPIKFVAE